MIDIIQPFLASSDLRINPLIRKPKIVKLKKTINGYNLFILLL